MANFHEGKHVDDMTELAELSEDSILRNLQIRYKNENIYTYTGTILVACNPYKWIEIYEDQYIKKYSLSKFGDLPPHIFAIAQETYKNMRENNENQSVIISGESGAGKTESTKLILQYLTAVTTNQNWVEQQIMEANTILEAFGNAKTVRNNNSSRFGKFMQVGFNKSKHICGASIVNYLLEKSRVITQAKDERNYHCFYQLCLGANDEEKQKYKLLPASKFNYLNKSGCIEFETIDDPKEFDALKLALTVLNLSPEEIDCIFKLLSAILHLGNIVFVEEGGGELSKPKDSTPLEAACELLSIDAKKALEGLCYRSIIVKGETSKIPLKKQEAQDNRDSISKAIYSRLFDWIVEYINSSIKSKEKISNFIGVLDIFGFELFKVNSFEQFCINFANEKLQQFFTNYIFKLEQAEYEKEGISWDKIQFKDNAETIELVEGKLGLLSLLDEETRFPKGTDLTYLAKINDKYEKHPFYIKPRQAKDSFGLRHYAGEVSYEIKGFLDKNKDEVSELMFNVLRKSKMRLLEILTEEREEGDDSKGGTKTMKKKNTVSGTFKGQLASLVSILSSTHPHYVRCIKPNSQKSAFLFEEELVLGQLRYSGMLETIRIRKLGYSIRVPYDQFLQRYYMLAPSAKGNDAKAKTEYILTNLKIDKQHFQPGKTKIFMRNTVFQPLEEAKDKFLREKAVEMSKAIIGNYYRKLFIRKRKAIGIIQKYIKMFLARNRYNKMKASSIIIQSAIRGWFARDFARMLREQKLEDQQRRKKITEEMENRRKKDEDARRTREAAAALVMEEKKKKEAEEAERLKKFQEEQEILTLTRQAQQVKKGEGKGKSDELGDMFSFLDVVDKTTKPEEPKVDIDIPDFNMEDLLSLDKKKKKTKKVEIDAQDNERSIDEMREGSGAYGLRKRKTISAMKSNPLSKKSQLNLFENLNNKKEDLPDDTMETYASKFFEEHEKVVGTLATLKKKKKPVSTKEMLHFTRQPIPLPMIKLAIKEENRKEKMITVAIEIFREILKIIDPYPKKEEAIYPIIQSVIKLGIGVPELRDEIFVQLIRQTTESTKIIRKWEIICIKGWQMMLLCLSCFPPSKTLSRYLRAYLKRTSSIDPNLEEDLQDKERDDEDQEPEDQETDMEVRMKRRDLRRDMVRYAELCEQAFQNVMLNGPRKYPPSSLEIEAIRSSRPIICRFYFLDGNVKAAAIEPWTTAPQAIQDLAKRINLGETAGWSLFEVSSDSEFAVKSSEIIGDVIARWEIEKKSSATETKYQTVKKGSLPTQAVGGGDSKLYMKKRLFKTPQIVPTDPVEYNLIYSQACEAVIRGDFPLNEQAAIRLAALKCQIEFGDYVKGKEKTNIQNIENFLPPKFSSTKEKNWIQEIVQVHSKLEGKSAIQAKVLYIEAVKQFPMYGGYLTPAVFKGYWLYSNNILIGINFEGIHWVHPKTKEVIKTYKYEQLETWELDVGTVTFYMKPEKINEEIDRLEFETKMNEEIVNLVKDYSPTHRVGKIKQVQKEEISAEEIGELADDVDRARETLLEQKILRIPGPATAVVPTTQKSKTMTLMKTTLSSKKKKEKEKGKSDDYTLEDWAFSKNKLSFPLLQNIDQSSENELYELCLKINACIFAYAGLGSPPGNYPEDESPVAPMSFMVQEVVKLCLDSPRLRDEFYLQTTKFTTLCPEPDSKTVIKVWKFLAVVCWVVLPSEPILTYVKAHLRNYAYSTSAQMNKRKQERDFARYCLKAVNRNMLKGARKQIPTALEISCSTHLNDMYTKFYFMDGQSRTLPFDPAATINEVIDMVKEKVGLKNCQGFSMFESFGTLERSMTGKEKIADTISKWDKFAKQTNVTPEKGLKLVFKKRLFMPPLNQFSNETEADFIMFQAISDVTNDKFPVTFDESIYLAGIRAQVELGDTGTYRAEETAYSDIIRKYMPKHFIKAGVPAQIAASHKNFKGKTKEECNKLYMEVIYKWEFYGTNIYNVNQTYTTAMPNELWLGINCNGIHIFNRRSKKPLHSYLYKAIVNYSPAPKNIMIMTDSLTRGTKYVFNTSEGSQISNLIKEYTEEIINSKKKELGAKDTKKK